MELIYTYAKRDPGKIEPPLTPCLCTTSINIRLNSGSPRTV